MRRNELTLFTALIAVLVFVGCSRIDESRAIRKTLALAGRNKVELLKVLDHYSNDPLKLKAARYLIANMQDASYFVGSGIDSIKAAMADISVYGAIDPARKQRWTEYRYEIGVDRIYDAQTLSSDYLIENIDMTFEAVEKWPWGKYYSFDDICRYILPYRIGDEKPERWRRAFADKYVPVMDSIYAGTDVVDAVISLHKYLKNSTTFVYENDFHSPRLGGEYLFKYSVGACREGTDMVTYILRSLGIPASADLYVYAPDSYLGHSWNVFMDTTGVMLPTEYGRETTSRDWFNHCSKGKVYRNGVDVTKMYYPHNKIRLSHLDRCLAGGLIGVFSINGWVPIGTYSRSMMGQAFIEDIETEQVYQPLSVSNTGQNQPSGYPFYLESDNIVTPLIPDFDNPQTIRLTRKHPLTEYWVIASEYQDSTTIQGSTNGIDWDVLTTTYTAKGVPRKRVSYPELSTEYRYIKVCHPKKARLSLAELEVFADRDGMKKIPLHVKEADEPLYSQEAYSAEKAIDGENLTRYEAGSREGSITFEMERASRVLRIDHVPHNDDNYVSPGDTYELFYQDGIHGWVSLGRKTATEDWLEYDNVPGGALLWLHDHTKGQEEQTFRWIDGRQVFCYEEYFKRRGNKRYL